MAEPVVEVTVEAPAPEAVEHETPAVVVVETGTDTGGEVDLAVTVGQLVERVAHLEEAVTHVEVVADIAEGTAEAAIEMAAEAEIVAEETPEVAEEKPEEKPAEKTEEFEPVKDETPQKKHWFWRSMSEMRNR